MSELTIKSPEQHLLDELADKRAQIDAALSQSYGFPLVTIQSDTHPKLQAIWCDNGLAGVGQVAIITQEFHPSQAEAICLLANSARAIPCLIDRIEQLEHELANARGHGPTIMESLREGIAEFIEVGAEDADEDEDDMRVWASNIRDGVADRCIEAKFETILRSKKP